MLICQQHGKLEKMASKWLSKGEKNSRKNKRKLIYYVCAQLLQYLLLFLSLLCLFFLMERPVKEPDLNFDSDSLWMSVYLHFSVVNRMNHARIVL